MSVDACPGIGQRAVGAYLGLAVGDALGATVEFLTPREIRERYGVHRDICGGGWLRLKPGQVTDDTQMSLALGDAILNSRGVDAGAVAESFSDWMRGKPVDIGNTVRRGLVSYRSSGKAVVPESEYDAGNGACMRCLPVALAYWRQPEEKLCTASRLQCHVTHNNAVSDAGTETVLRMVVAALTGRPKESLQQLADELAHRHAVFRYMERRVENPGGWIVETLQAVFQAVFSNHGFESILVDVVNRGGDADNTGAIAGMLAGAYCGPDAIPDRWLEVLDDDTRKACRKQALDLISLAGQLVH